MQESIYNIIISPNTVYKRMLPIVADIIIVATINEFKHQKIFLHSTYFLLIPVYIIIPYRIYE